MLPTRVERRGINAQVPSRAWPPILRALNRLERLAECRCRKCQPASAAADIRELEPPTRMFRGISIKSLIAERAPRSAACEAVGFS